MSRRAKIHVGLEIGTSKTCVVVGEIRPDSSVKILGIGESRSAGVRKGEICDHSTIRACVKDAIKKAEDASDVEIGTVYLAVTGSHIQGINNRGICRLPDNEKVVTQDHVKEASDLAREVQIPVDHVPLHPIIRNYWLDGLEHAISPIGLYGKTMAVDFHIIHGMASRMHNSVKMLQEIPIGVDDIVFSPIATAQMVLEREQREQGALVVDIGGGTTDYALYLNGVIAASGCIPVGGDHITNDIHLVTRLQWSKAEALKVQEGNASGEPVPENEIARLPDERGFADAEVPRYVLNGVIHARLSELFQLLLQRLPGDAPEQIKAGVFLTGGTSLMRGISALAYETFRCPIYHPQIPELTGIQAGYRDPRYTTPVGLIRYAQILDAERTPKRGVFSRICRMFWPFGD